MSDSGFYGTRAHLTGRVDSQWTPTWDDGQNVDGCPTDDQRNGGSGQATTGGTLSQADLTK